MKHMQKKSTSILGALSQPGATLDADSSWAMAVALCSAVETLIDLQLRISRLCIPHAQERLACVLRRRSARRSAVGADESRGSAALVRSCHPRVVRERLGGARPSCLEDQSLIRGSKDAADVAACLRGRKLLLEGKISIRVARLCQVLQPASACRIPVRAVDLHASSRYVDQPRTRVVTAGFPDHACVQDQGGSKDAADVAACLRGRKLLLEGKISIRVARLCQVLQPASACRIPVRAVDLHASSRYVDQPRTRVVTAGFPDHACVQDQGATLDADSSWAMAVALCSAVETLIDLQLRISRPNQPAQQQMYAQILFDFVEGSECYVPSGCPAPRRAAAFRRESKNAANSLACLKPFFRSCYEHVLSVATARQWTGQPLLEEVVSIRVLGHGASFQFTWFFVVVLGSWKQVLRHFVGGAGFGFQDQGLISPRSNGPSLASTGCGPLPAVVTAAKSAKRMFPLPSAWTVSDMSGICGIFLPLLGSLLGQPREQFAWHLHQECVALIEPAGCKSCPMAVPGREYVQRQACNREKSTPINYFVGGLLLVRPVDFPNTASG
ncbi:hypothetical protein AK812_SmicGene43439 [Symbiodinium microadriaticum]|uniref:Uncharacterized protein n=1 Tax=Symbiodinium microadriaticum TaxID=2951 RepID=A0A1Q9C105_SYMMI|nr:hypothetical protein AK812_SmicGene43439 [Symbiodinium microadriaticum]